MPSAAPGATSSALPTEVGVNRSESSDGVAVIFDQFSTREILQGRRVQIDKVAQAQAKPTMLGWFVGQVMKQTGGKANPQSVNELLKSKLGI